MFDTFNISTIKMFDKEILKLEIHKQQMYQTL